MTFSQLSQVGLGWGSGCEESENDHRGGTLSDANALSELTREQTESSSLCKPPGGLLFVQTPRILATELGLPSDACSALVASGVASGLCFHSRAASWHSAYM